VLILLNCLELSRLHKELFHFMKNIFYQMFKMLITQNSFKISKINSRYSTFAVYIFKNAYLLAPVKMWECKKRMIKTKNGILCLTDAMKKLIGRSAKFYHAVQLIIITNLSYLHLLENGFKHKEFNKLSFISWRAVLHSYLQCKYSQSNYR